MKITDIQILEATNTNSCFLIKEGIFWRAYERSAMVFCNHIKKYQVTKKYFKVITGDLIYLGFPDQILDEILSLCENKEIKRHEKLIEINGFDESNGFDTWKSSVDYAEHVIENKLNAKLNGDIYKVIERIRQYPIAERTPIESQLFIIELQNLINGTI
jgi:hypothetical protein